MTSFSIIAFLIVLSLFSFVKSDPEPKNEELDLPENPTWLSTYTFFLKKYVVKPTNAFMKRFSASTLSELFVEHVQEQQQTGCTPSAPTAPTPTAPTAPTAPGITILYRIYLLVIHI